MASPQAPEEEDFEDFGDFGEAQAEQDTPQPQVTLTQSDPSTERWQSLFSHLFGQKTEAEGDSGIEGTGESVGVREVLVRWKVSYVCCRQYLLTTFIANF